MFERYTWRGVIGKVDIGPGEIIWLDLGKRYEVEEWRIQHKERPPDMKDYFSPFGAEKFPTKQDAVLSRGECRTAIYLPDSIIRELLKDMDVQIQDILVAIKNPRLCFIDFMPGWMPLRTVARHNVFQSTSSNGEKHVLDMTEPQYGWSGPAMMPWHTFSEERMDRLKEGLKSGVTVQELTAHMSPDAAVRELHQLVLERMKKACDHYLGEWQRQSGVSFGSLLRSPEKHFQEMKDSLLRYLESCMLLARDEINNGLRAAECAHSNTSL
ncbi:MAG: hypothetical protein Q9221_008702 [Calogaya cf. arnoldii]